MSGDNEALVRSFFSQAKPRLTKLAGRLVDEPGPVVDAAETIFGQMIPDMAYVDKPAHPLASALFVCCVNLSLYLALKDQGIDAHRFGDSLLTGIVRAPAHVFTDSLAASQNQMVDFVAAAEASQTSALPGEDVFEAIDGDGNDFDLGINIKSCAICHQFAKYGAMDLVPYMCAVDDAMSDRFDQGLKRTGTIALGADQCDFRYKRGGEPRRLDAEFPDQIRRAKPA